MLSAFAPLLFSCVVAGDTPTLTALLDQSGSVVVATATTFERGVRLGSDPERFIRVKKELYGVFHFRVDEVLHGRPPKDVLAFGFESKRHRTAGSCWALGYTIGARYVLILDAKGRLFDYPLTPVNEEASERWIDEIKAGIAKIKAP